MTIYVMYCKNDECPDELLYTGFSTNKEIVEARRDRLNELSSDYYDYTILEFTQEEFFDKYCPFP